MIYWSIQWVITSSPALVQSDECRTFVVHMRYSGATSPAWQFDESDAAIPCTLWEIASSDLLQRRLINLFTLICRARPASLLELSVASLARTGNGTCASNTRIRFSGANNYYIIYIIVMFCSFCYWQRYFVGNWIIFYQHSASDIPLRFTNYKRSSVV